MKNILSLFLLAPITLLAAGHDQGNGGDGIYCVRSGVPSVEFYDQFEAREVHGMQLRFPSASLSERERLVEVLKPIEKLNPRRALLYMQWYDSFYQEVRFTQNDLIDVPDTGSGEIPPDCVLKQVIVQKDPQFPKDRRYTIAEKYWKLMNSDSRLMAIVHELALRDAVTRSGHTNSIQTRYFNGKIFEGTGIETLQSYLRLLQMLNFKNADAHGFPISLDNTALTFHDSDTVKKALVELKAPFPFNGGVAHFWISGYLEVAMEFNKQGKPIRLPRMIMSRETRLETPVAVFYPWGDHQMDGIKIIFDEAGNIDYIGSNTFLCIEHPRVRLNETTKRLCGPYFYSDSNSVRIYQNNGDYFELLIQDVWKRVQYAELKK